MLEIKVELNSKNAEKFQFRTAALFLRELRKNLLQKNTNSGYVHCNTWILAKKVMINHECSEFLNSISRPQHGCPCSLNLDQREGGTNFLGETLSIPYLKCSGFTILRHLQS